MIDLAIVIFGFGMIIFIHEAGHFLAARWAGIRVLAFAVGFGPAFVSWRKGMGLRRGSSEREYEKLKARSKGKSRRSEKYSNDALANVSPTEYRLNVLPFGGYVKMLGQEDADPTARSDEPDSYQNCKVWKRMIVISAGVAMNIVSAAILFVIVFSVGLETEPAKIGSVRPGSPAAMTVASNATIAGVTEAGFIAGDKILSIDGRMPNSFNDVMLASAMAERGKPINMTIERSGVSQPLEFTVVPVESRTTGLLEVGFGPAFTTQIMPVSSDFSNSKAGKDALAAWAERMKDLGLEGVKLGMTLTHANGQPVEHLQDLSELVRASQGEPLTLRFTDGSTVVEGTISPTPELEQDNIKSDSGDLYSLDHLLGLTGVIRVASVGDSQRGRKQGLETADVFERIGSTEFPSIVRGTLEIRQHKGKRIEVAMSRRADGVIQVVNAQPTVTRKGQIGFTAGDTNRLSTLLALPEPYLFSGVGESEKEYIPAAAQLIDVPGTSIEAIAGVRVTTIGEVQIALTDATLAAFSAGEESVDVEMMLRLPYGENDDDIVTKTWTLTRDELERLHNLAWVNPLDSLPFAPEQFLLKGSSPADSLSKGISETRRVTLSVYTTFVRLFQGSLKVQHLKGPVGIAHLGTLVADKGWIWLLFLAAIVSVNLAVINFLPLPIVDGGQFLFLLFEGVRGKPVPVGIQNAFALVGIALIGVVFVIVTYNDIVGLFAGL